MHSYYILLKGVGFAGFVLWRATGWPGIINLSCMQLRPGLKKQWTSHCCDYYVYAGVCLIVLMMSELQDVNIVITAFLLCKLYIILVKTLIQPVP